MTLPQPEKFNLNSLDIAEDNRAKLKALFPSVFAEARNDEGELVESIDFEKLKAEIGSFSEAFENRRERYGMDWPGKKDCIKLVQQPATGTLKPCREESVNFDSTENLFIEGDNLEVLKLLQKSYYGKVKMIYIDPPYNTGKEFIYPDHYAETLETYLAYAGLVDDEGKKFSTNTANEGRFHTRWLNMMHPRLYLARNLLTEDGMIFISIDSNELYNLRAVCDEIFGEENLVGTLIWKGATDNNPTQIAVEHEYILCYAKNRGNSAPVWKSLAVDAKQLMLDEYKRLKEIFCGDISQVKQEFRRFVRNNAEVLSPLTHYTRVDKGGIYTGSRKVHNPKPGGYVYDVLHKDSKKPCVQPANGYRYPQERMQELIEQDRIIFGTDETQIIQIKEYLSDYEEKLSSVITLDSRAGANEMGRLFENRKVFTNPKPHELLKQVFDFVLQDADIAMDFFAGSCASAQAILELSNISSNRKFIMVQLPTPCDECSIAHNLGYKSIADIGKERIRRVIRKIENGRLEEEHRFGSIIPGMSEPISELDLGFKVLKLDRSNFNLWDGSNPNATADELVQQLELHIDPIDPAATQEDILYELLLKSGFMPTEKIEKRLLAGKTVYAIAENTLLVCLEDEITRELIDAVVATDFQQFLCLDKAFKGNDQLKANAVQTFNTLNQDRDKERQIIFKTV